MPLRCRHPIATSARCRDPPQGRPHLRTSNCGLGHLLSDQVDALQKQVADLKKAGQAAGRASSQGSGRGVVVVTGASTSFGKIASGLAGRPPETGFQVGLRKFSKLLATIALVVSILVFVINTVLGRPPLEALLFSLAIAVGLTPELFPAIVSVSLSAGSRALAKRHVLVKRLVAIEDLGNIQVLFTDKTGTLTEGAITFNRAVGPDGKEAAEPFRLGLLCNEATMTDSGPVGGNPLDQALLTAAAARPVSGPEEGGPAAYRRLGILPFDHKRQMSSVLVAQQDRPPMLITKGAPEAVLTRCPALPRGAQATLDQLFADGERVVAVATRDVPSGTSAITAHDERQLTLAGFLTFADRPKPDAGPAVAKLSGLGVDVKIITGDNGVVAAKVCREIGIKVAGVVNGTDLAKLDDNDLAAAIPGTTVFARVSPDQKSRIIMVARRAGKDVAFMGDGVNDAVAIHQCRPHRVPYRLVRGVDRDPDTDHLRGPHPADTVLPEPAQPADVAGPHGRGGHRYCPAVHGAESCPWVHTPACRLLPRPGRPDRDLHGAGRRGQGPLLPGARRTAGGARRKATHPRHAASDRSPVSAAVPPPGGPVHDSHAHLAGPVACESSGFRRERHAHPRGR